MDYNLILGRLHHVSMVSAPKFTNKEAGVELRVDALKGVQKEDFSICVCINNFDKCVKVAAEKGQERISLENYDEDSTKEFLILSKGDAIQMVAGIINKLAESGDPVANHLEAHLADMVERWEAKNENDSDDNKKDSIWDD